VRVGDPIDEPRDQGLPIWAGLIAVERRFGPPVDAQDLGPGLAPPAHLIDYER